MSTIKSFSVGNGDAYYIDHNTDNFSIIDCFLPDEEKIKIVEEIKALSSKKGITRFVSTHPDQDHIGGLKFLDDSIKILNFYCVKNNVSKKDVTEDFNHYCSLRDSTKAFYIEAGCSRKWMNKDDNERKSSGINILWPNLENQEFKNALKEAEKGGSPNNISIILRYAVTDGVSALWMGDLETDFMESIKDEIKLPKTDIVFAPHHGRDTGKIPEDWLKKIDPKIIVIGEAPSEDLNYYIGYNTITQNSAGDITFKCKNKKVHVFVTRSGYYDFVDFLDDENVDSDTGNYYIGTLNL